MFFVIDMLFIVPQEFFCLYKACVDKRGREKSGAVLWTAPLFCRFVVYFDFLVLRRVTMNTFEYFFGFRVLRPPVTLPYAVFGRLVPRP